MRINAQDIDDKLIKNIARIVMRSFIWIEQNEAETVSVLIKYRGGVLSYYYLRCRTSSSICVLAGDSCELY